MKKYLDFFEGVFYINLDTRIDRKNTFQKRAKEISLPAERISGITPEDHEVSPLYEGHEDSRRKYKVGCTLSHQFVIRTAKKLGLKNCLIFEDDCVFLEDFGQDLKNCVKDLSETRWDLFYLGGEPNNFCLPIAENIASIQNGGIYATHAYAINESFYDIVLEQNAFKIDTIDIFYLNYPSELRRYILSKKILAIQDKDYSDLWDTIKDSGECMIKGWEKYVK